MSEAQHYINLLKTGQITPAAIEKRLNDLIVELDDSKFFGKSSAIIQSLETRVNDLKKVLAQDYAGAVVRGIEEPVAPASVQPILKKIVTEKPITELYDGTKLTEAESQEAMDLLRKAREGGITKTTLLEALRSLEPTIEKALARRDPNDPYVLELLFKKLLLQHVIMHGKFGKYFRRNPSLDEVLRELGRLVSVDPSPENLVAYSSARIRAGLPCQICDPEACGAFGCLPNYQSCSAQSICDQCHEAVCANCVVVCPCGRSSEIICKNCQNFCGDKISNGCGKTLCEWCQLSCSGCEMVFCGDCLQSCSVAKVDERGIKRYTCRRSLCRNCCQECNFCGESFCADPREGCLASCLDCRTNYCANCVFICPVCKKAGCPEETFKCKDCNLTECRDCAISGSSLNYCGECEQMFCREHRCECFVRRY